MRFLGLLVRTLQNAGARFREVSDKFDDKAVFVKLDVDENEDAAMKYGITSIPNVILFKNGKPAANSLGFLPEKALADFVEKNI